MVVIKSIEKSHCYYGSWFLTKQKKQIICLVIKENGLKQSTEKAKGGLKLLEEQYRKLKKMKLK